MRALKQLAQATRLHLDCFATASGAQAASGFLPKALRLKSIVCQGGDSLRHHAISHPASDRCSADAIVEIDGGLVPGQNRTLETRTLAVGRDLRQVGHQGKADAGAAKLRSHEEVFQVERFLSFPCGVGVETEGKSCRHAVVFGNQAFKWSFFGPQLVFDRGDCHFDGMGLSLVVGQFGNQSVDQGSITRCRFSNADHVKNLPISLARGLRNGFVKLLGLQAAEKFSARCYVYGKFVRDVTNGSVPCLRSTLSFAK